MASTLICHICGQKLVLFDSCIKRRHGKIRCTHCGAPISYDLDSRKIQKSGFWAAKECPFDISAKNRLLTRSKKDNTQNTLQKQNNPFHAKAGFEKFDLKTGTVTKSDSRSSKRTLPKTPVTSPQKHKKHLPVNWPKVSYKKPAVSSFKRISKISSFWQKIKKIWSGKAK